MFKTNGLFECRQCTVSNQRHLRIEYIGSAYERLSADHCRTANRGEAEWHPQEVMQTCRNEKAIEEAVN